MNRTYTPLVWSQTSPRFELYCSHHWSPQPLVPELYLVSCGWSEYQVALQVGAELLSLAELLLLPVQALVEPTEERLEPRPRALLHLELLEQRLLLLARLLGLGLGSGLRLRFG